MVMDVDFWMVREKHVAGPILRQLSEPLRLANFAAIRRKANIYRQPLVKEFVLTQRDSDSNMQGWASVNGFSSVMQPYWHIYDVEHARRTARARLQTGANEGDQRGRTIMTMKCDGVPGRRMARIDARNLRACYLCEAVQGQHGVYAGVFTPYADYVPECEDGGTQGEIEGGSSFALRNRGRPPRAPPSGAESVGDVVAYDAVYNKREFLNTSTPECEAA